MPHGSKLEFPTCNISYTGVHASVILKHQVYFKGTTMTLQLSWYLENRVILLTIHGENSEKELFDVDRLVINYLNQSSAPLVHCILDQTNAIVLPTFKAAALIMTTTKLKWPNHPQYGWAIIIGQTHPLLRFVTAVATSFFKIRQRGFRSMDEGLDFLNAIDSTLPMLRVNRLGKTS